MLFLHSPFMKQGYDYPNGDQLQNSGYVGQNYLPNSPLSNTAYGTFTFMQISTIFSEAWYLIVILGFRWC